MILGSRFWDKVNKTEICWEWLASKTPQGYGKYSIDNTYWAAHRASFTEANGPIPEGLVVCHHCDNPGCVRPSHLFLGTQKDNLQDCKRKKRSWHFVHPERAARGDANGSRKHPERLWRGEQNVNAKLNEDAVRDIRRAAETRVRGTYARLAEKYGVTLPLIRAVVKRIVWKHVQ